jgi:CheY-like chemotaxis protein
MNIFQLSPESLKMKILLLTTDQELARLREYVLQDAGHEVLALSTEKEIFDAVEKQVPFDLALLCHRLPDATARKIIRIFREDKRSGKVVYIAHIYGEWPEVEADRYIVGADGPEALLRIVSETASEQAPLSRSSVRQ